MLATLLASCGGYDGGRLRPSRPDPVRRADDARPGGPGRRRECRDHGPAVRVADRVRRRPPGPTGPRRVVDVRGRRTAGHLPPPPEPDLLGRQPAPAVGRGPQLAAADRSAAARRRWPRSPSTSRAPRRTCAASRPIRRRSGCTPTTPAATLTVDLVRPATDFVNIIAGPTFGVVPPGVDDDPDPALAARQRTSSASGGYILTGTTADGLELTANDRYWAGKPAITTIELVADLGGRNAVDAFSAGDLDYTPVVGHRRVVARLRRDARAAAPARSRSLSVQYYGFDTTKAAVRRSARPAGLRRGDRLAPDGGAERHGRRPPRSRTRWSRRGSRAGATRTSCRGTTRPTRATLLAKAGYPGGAGFPTTILHDRRLRVRRGDRRRGEARARDHPPGRDDGRRLLRPPVDRRRRRCGRSAGSPTTRAGTTSSACCSARARRTTTATGARPPSTRRSRRPSRRPIPPSPRRPTTGPRRSSATRSRSCRSRTARAGR